MCAIPASWKSEIRKFGKRLPVVKSQNIERLFRTKMVTSFTYDTLRGKSVAIQPAKVQSKWNKYLLSPVGDWTTNHSIPFFCTSASKLRSFQFRILHRIIGTNILFMKMGIKDRDKCHRAPLLVM